MAVNAPFGPMSTEVASQYASGSCSIQKPTKSIAVGVYVSPAPLIAWTTIMPTAYAGAPIARMRRQVVAMDNTSGSFVKSPAMPGARTNIVIPTPVMNIVL